MSEPDPILPPTLPANAKRPRALVALSAGGSYQAPVPIYLPGAEPTVRTVLRSQYLQGGGFSGTFQAPAPMVITPITPLWPDPVGAWLSEETYFGGTAASDINAGSIGTLTEGDISISIWANFPARSSDGNTFFCITDTNANPYLLLAHSSKGYVLAMHGPDDIWPSVSDNTTTSQDVGKWNHFVIKSEGTAWKLYCNGTYRAGRTLNTLAGTFFNGLYLFFGYVGYAAPHNPQRFTGSLMNFQVFDQALTNDEIAALYAAGR